MYKRTLSYYLNNGRWWFAFLFLGFLSNCITSAAPITVSAPNSTYFIANEGQWEGDFQFKCEVGSTVYYVTPKGMTVDFREFKKYPKPLDQKDPTAMFERDRERDSVTVRGHVEQIQYVGGNTRATSVGEGKLSHYSNYFLGRDSTNWRSRVGHYQNIIVPEVWPGIDVEYRADQQGVETIYHVKPGADPSQIRMEYLGLNAPLRVDAQGNLILTTSLGDVKEKAPFAFQQEARTQKQVDAGFRVINDKRVGYELGAFDTGKVLVVDPLLYGTYLGGGDVDECDIICSATDDGAYVAGFTRALSGFPTTPGAYDETGLYPGRRLFCCHFGPNGEFIASTLFGIIQTPENPGMSGGVWDMVYDSDRAGLWIAGYARNDDWPLTPDAYDAEIDEDGDGFLLRFDVDLTTIQYCTYLGGNSDDLITALQLGNDGKIYAAGSTFSTDFPVTPDAFSTMRQGNDCFLWVFDPDALEVSFSTYFGGTDDEYHLYDIALDESGALWLLAQTESADIPVTGNAFQSTIGDSLTGRGDCMLAGVSFTPPEIEYCSYFGGVDLDVPNTLAVKDSMIYMAGWSYSFDYPISINAYDTSNSIGLTGKAMISGINPETNTYFGTFFGGNGYEQFVRNANWVHDSTLTLLGVTTSNNLPVTPDAYQATLRDNDGFITKFNLSLSSVSYCSYIGGSGDDDYVAAYAINPDSLWVIGSTLSIDFPTTPDALQPGDNALTSGFVQKFAIDTTLDTTDASGAGVVPRDYLFSVFPNPFNTSTTISFTLLYPAHAEISVYNILGQKVEYIDRGRLAPGTYEQVIGNAQWASGIYFTTLSLETRHQNTKLMLLR